MHKSTHPEERVLSPGFVCIDILRTAATFEPAAGHVYLRTDRQLEHALSRETQCMQLFLMSLLSLRGFVMSPMPLGNLARHRVDC